MELDLKRNLVQMPVTQNKTTTANHSSHELLNQGFSKLIQVSQ